MTPDRRYVGKWILVPELCIYEVGEPPASGLYTIAAIGDRVRITIRWTTQAGDAHTIEFEGLADGAMQPRPDDGGPSHLSFTHVDAGVLDSRAFEGDLEVAYARRCASVDGANLSTVQVGHRADGSTYRNFQVYRRVPQ